MIIGLSSPSFSSNIYKLIFVHHVYMRRKAIWNIVNNLINIYIHVVKCVKQMIMSFTLMTFTEDNVDYY